MYVQYSNMYMSISSSISKPGLIVSISCLEASVTLFDNT